MKAQDKYLKNVLQSPHAEALAQLPLPHEQLGLVVCIPAYNESELLSSLDSLLACDQPKCKVEILVNINYPETASEAEQQFNKTLFDLLSRYSKQASKEWITIHPLLFSNQKKKQAGVGLARKQIMDIAFQRLMQVHNEKGLICGFDADSLVEKNYFCTLEKAFSEQAQQQACSIQFKHPTRGNKYTKAQYQAIALYELHLRYYVYMLQQIGTPFAFQTIGSSFAVRAQAYAQVNGMTAHKAGEDFYFLQKMMFLGGFFQLNKTCIYPSSRISNRVGFGTGPSVGEIMDEQGKNTFCYASFFEIEKILNDTATFFKPHFDIEQLDYPEILTNHLKSQKFEEKIENMKLQHKDYTAFKQAVMHWFGGFRILKMLNLLSGLAEFKNENILDAVKHIEKVPNSSDPLVLLDYFRTIDAQESIILQDKTKS